MEVVFLELKCVKVVGAIAGNIAVLFVILGIVLGDVAGLLGKMREDAETVVVAQLENRKQGLLLQQAVLRSQDVSTAVEGLAVHMGGSLELAARQIVP